MACITEDCLDAYICGFTTDLPNDKDNAVWYKIKVEMKDVCWQLEKRFSDFEMLNKKLVETQGIPTDNFTLPPKRYIGNKDPAFIEKRKEKLDHYLRNIVHFFGKNLPEDLARFLGLYDYEMTFLLKRLAQDIFENGDHVLQNNSSFAMTPYQICAINRKMKQVLSPLPSEDKRHDFSHIVDFCCNLRYLEIIGSNIPLGKSTIIPNQYSIDLSPFKNLMQISLKTVNTAKLEKVGSCRETLRIIAIHDSHLKSPKEIFFCDTLYKSFKENSPSVAWPKLTSLFLSNNDLEDVEDLGNCVPSLRHIDLSFNHLSSVFSLTSLPYLENVSYAGNVIRELRDLHLYFGNVKHIDLSHNQLEKLDGFSRLYSLCQLNIGCNNIRCVEEVEHLCKLPCLEILILTGNPVAKCVDYRVKTLSYFGSRAAQISLDNENASVTEIDQVSILQAIQSAKSMKKEQV